MKNYHIAVIPGDGIGQEVIPEGLKALRAVSQVRGDFRMHFETFPWGSEYYLQYGHMMSSDGLRTLEKFDAIYFGAVGWPSVPDAVSLRGLRLAICQGFDQYANLRPAVLLPGVTGPLRGKSHGDIDFIVVRENSEGEYSGAGGRVHQGFPEETALQTSVFTRAGVERILRFAYELARSRTKKQLVSTTKTNAQPHIFGLWDEVAEALSVEYPEVRVERVLVDALAARFVLQPETLDVVVASNLFADILTDLSGAICGSLGMAPSANLNPERRFPSMFEPIHGSAPDIFGKRIANPVAMIWSGALMLDFLGEKQAAGRMLEAVKGVVAERRILTPDLGGSARTHEVGDAVEEKIFAFGAAAA